MRTWPSKTQATFHGLEIISVYKTLAPQKVFFSRRRGHRPQNKSPRPFHCQALFFFFFFHNTTLFISAITAQTDSSSAQLSSPTASISTCNLISPKERKANEQRRAERQREKRPAIMSICVGLEQQLYVFVCVCMDEFFPLCFFPFFLLLLFSLFLSPFFFFFQRKKAFKGAIVQGG